jgi:hypothetical protein
MSEEIKNSLSYFDRAIGSLHGLPDVVTSKPTTLRVVPTFGLGSHTYIVQTFRQKEIGDTIFLEVGSAEGNTRIVIPCAVADCIARQRDQLSHKTRSRSSKRVMEERMARGEKPGFMKRS